MPNNEPPMTALTDPRWDLLPHLFAGELEADAAQELETWIASDVERQQAVARLHDVWIHATVDADEWNVEAGVAAIRERTMPEGRVIARVGPRTAPMEALPKRGMGMMAWRLAAAVAVLVTGTLVWRVMPPRLGAPSAVAAVTEYTTRPGQRLAIRLQDGTLVTLAPGSKLRQPATYGRRERTVFLDGEAYFVVTHDAARPFAVHTAHAVARDLGTRFDIRAYAADSTTDVVVAEGLVAVGRLDTASTRGALASDSVLLRQGGRAQLGTGGPIAVSRGVALASYVDWTEGRLVFQDAPLDAAGRQLARWHDVTIRFADARTRTRRLTASFGDEPIADVVHRIAASLDLEVTRAGRVFTLRAR